MIKFFKKNTGFSFLELVVVCLLISTLLAIAIPAFLNARHNADKQKGIYNLYAIYQAQKMYFFDQDPQQYSFDIMSLLPYATISEDDGSWGYLISFSGGASFTATANHKLPDGTSDGFWISIDETGSIDDAPAHWPY
ncbi:MAG: type II secretion system protein [Candidatus Omnitrophota bacterium]